MKTSFINCLFIVFVVLFVIMFVLADVPGQLEQNCECKYNNELQSHELLCKGKKLTSIPQLSKFQNCSFKKIDISRNDISLVTKESFINITEVSIVYMYMDNIDKIEVDTFENLVYLNEIDLSDNDLQYVNPNMFSKNTLLEIVDLSKNPLVETSDKISILNAPSVKKLSLSGCKLEKINSEMFSELRNLRHLDLSANNFQVISTDTFLCMNSLKTVEIYNNRWKCDCHLFTLMEFLRELGPSNGETQHIQRVRCYSEVGGKIRWSDADSQSQNCKQKSKSSCKEQQIEETTMLANIFSKVLMKNTHPEKPIARKSEGVVEDSLIYQYAIPIVGVLVVTVFITTTAVIYVSIKYFNRASGSRLSPGTNGHVTNHYTTNIKTALASDKKLSAYDSKLRLMSSSSTGSKELPSPMPAIVSIYSDEIPEVFRGYPSTKHLYERLRSDET